MLSFPRLLTLLTFIALFAMATRVAMDVDTWWHMQAGKWMVEHGAVLREDVFTHTFLGAPWDYPAWLSETVMYGIFNAGGYAGLNLLTAACVTLAFAFVWATCEGHVLVRAGAVLLAATASAVFWSARPQIISFVLSAILLYILWLYRRRGLNRLWVLPVLVALWVNTHPGYAVAFIFLGLTLIGEFLEAGLLTLRTRLKTNSPEEALAEKKAWQRVAWLVGISAACAVAILASPYGFSVYGFPFKTVGSSLLQNYIQEWQSPNFHLREAQVFIWLALATLGAVGLSRKAVALSDLLLFGGCFYLALVAGRNIALFALVAAPLLARHAQAAWEDAASRLPWLGQLQRPTPAPRPLTLFFNWIILLALTLAGCVKVAIPLETKLNETLVLKDLPVGAVAYLRQHQPAGPMFHPYHWGGYLSWALYPDYLVYVDGRTDLYGADFLRGYLRIAGGAATWEADLAQHHVQLLVVEKDSAVAQLAQASGRWREVYGDAVARVFVPAPEGPP